MRPARFPILLVVVLGALACAGTQQGPQAHADSGATADAHADEATADATEDAASPTPAEVAGTPPFPGHPLVGSWEAPAGFFPHDDYYYRRTFYEDGSSRLRTYLVSSSDTQVCRWFSEATNGTWAPAGVGAFVGSRVRLESWRECSSSASTARVPEDVMDLEGRHTFTIAADGTLRIDPTPGGRVYHRTSAQ